MCAHVCPDIIEDRGQLCWYPPSTLCGPPGLHHKNLYPQAISPTPAEAFQFNVTSFFQFLGLSPALLGFFSESFCLYFYLIFGIVFSITFCISGFCVCVLVEEQGSNSILLQVLPALAIEQVVFFPVNIFDIFAKKQVSQLCEFITGSPILFHWPTFLFLQRYYTVLQQCRQILQIQSQPGLHSKFQAASEAPPP